MHAKAILDAQGYGPKTADLLSVTPDARLMDVARMFKENRIGFALVRADSGDGWLGTVSERDIIHALADLQDASAMTAKTVRDALTPNMVTCAPDDALDTLRELMTERRTRHIVVTDTGDASGAVQGLVSIGDLIKHQLAKSRVETEAMRDYVSGVGYQ